MREILGSGGASYPSMPLTRQTRDAFAKYVELRWPVARRKRVEAEWGLTPDEARAVCEAKASATTIDKVFKHKNGGWAVIIPVLGAVVGTSLDQHIENERRVHAERAETLGEVVRSLRFGRPAGDLRPDQSGSEPGERRQPQDRRVGG